MRSLRAHQDETCGVKGKTIVRSKAGVHDLGKLKKREMKLILFLSRKSIKKNFNFARNIL